MSVAIAAICGLIVGIPALPLLITRDDSAATTGWVVLLAMPLLAVVLWPRLLNWAIATVLRILRREPLERQLSGRAVLSATLLFIAAWVCSGLHVLVLARATSTDYETGRCSLRPCPASRWHRRSRCSASSCPPASASARASWC